MDSRLLICNCVDYTYIFVTLSFFSETFDVGTLTHLPKGHCFKLYMQDDEVIIEGRKDMVDIRKKYTHRRVLFADTEKNKNAVEAVRTRTCVPRESDDVIFDPL